MKLYLAGILFTLAVVPLWAANEPDLELGKEAYGLHCARCHGITGNGEGIDANRVPVHPRNFQRGEYKFRSTVSGTPPSDADLMKVINNGIAKGGMPGFNNLPLNVKEGIIAYIKTMKGDGEEKSIFQTYDAEPIDPPNTKMAPNFAEGKLQYEKLQCALCHGNGGRANGTSAATLKGSDGKPLPPANLVHGWTYGGGNSAEDIYYRLMTGLAGTPMPAYEGAISPEGAWHLAHYVVSLQQETDWQAGVYAKEIKTGTNWDQANESVARMESSYYQFGRKHNGSIQAVNVKAMYDTQGVTTRLSWDDTTETKNGLPDQIVMALQPEGWEAIPQRNLYTMYSSNSPELDIFLWRSDRPDVIEVKKGNLTNALYPWFQNETKLDAKATYTDGLWELEFTLPYREELKDTYVSFAAWDGSKRESGPKRSTSQWIPFRLGEAPVAVH